MFNLFKRVKGRKPELSKEEKQAMIESIDKVQFIVDLGAACCKSLETYGDSDTLEMMRTRNSFMEKRIEEMNKRLA